jgi:sodium transport system permease protein
MVWRVTAKELRETLRDRRTLTMMVAIPIFLYPVLFVVIQQLALFGQRKLSEKPAEVAVVGDSAGMGAETAAWLEGDSALRVTRQVAIPDSALKAGTVEAVVILPPADTAASATAEVRLLYDRTRARSQRAHEVVSDRLDAWGDTLLRRRLEEARLPASFARPLAVRDTSVATPQQVGAYALSSFLPMILILMTVLGAFYPAIDMAAGEKERGTLETLLTAPVPNRELVAGKFAAVSLIGFSAAALNLASMLLTFQAGLFQFGKALGGVSFNLPLGSIALVLAAMLPVAVFFAALFLGIAVRAHSFKEAQNALTPIYLGSMIPMMLASAPGVEFTVGMAAIPIGGVAFLFRALLAGNAPFVPSLVAVVSTGVYAALALWFAARSFGREDVLFGTGGDGVKPGVGWGERLAAWRAGGGGSGRVPTPREAWAVVAVTALLYFYGAVWLMSTYGERGLIGIQLLLIAAPALLFVRLGGFDARETLGLRPPAPRAAAAALLLGVGAVPVGWALGMLQLRWLDVPEGLFEQLQALTTAETGARLVWLVFLVALLPGVCEELVFRGLLFRSLARRHGQWTTIAVSALVFGAFHLSVETAIRLLPTAWLGLVMGYVAWHSRSTVATMGMHFVNNALAVVIVSTPALRGWIFADGQSPHPALLAAGPVLMVLGVWLLPRRPAAPWGVPETAAAAPVPAPPPADADAPAGPADPTSSDRSPVP